MEDLTDLFLGFSFIEFDKFWAGNHLYLGANSCFNNIFHNL